MEPLLGRIDLTTLTLPGDQPGQYDALTGHVAWTCLIVRGDQTLMGPLSVPRLDWIIVGGESGAGARPMHPDWARGLRDQCAAASVPMLFKQWGEWLPWEPDALPYWQSQTGTLIDRHQLPDFNDPDVTSWTDSLMYEGDDIAVHQRVGKRAAGRRLDGATHDGAPA